MDKFHPSAGLNSVLNRFDAFKSDRRSPPSPYHSRKQLFIQPVSIFIQHNCTVNFRCASCRIKLVRQTKLLWLELLLGSGLMHVKSISWLKLTPTTSQRCVRVTNFTFPDGDVKSSRHVKLHCRITTNTCSTHTYTHNTRHFTPLFLAGVCTLMFLLFCHLCWCL